MREVPSAALTCIKCHGVLGSSVFPEVPNLAGQNKNYLVKQLAAFRDTADNESSVGEDGRYHYVMAEQARYLTDPVIDELSAFFSGLSCR
ncbi:MAG: c-type cytochrome [Rhodospirillaceae bacterium]|nr:c-type cytochrome [Rhodospirillaceae bacterium]